MKTGINMKDLSAPELLGPCKTSTWKLKGMKLELNDHLPCSGGSFFPQCSSSLG